MFVVEKGEGVGRHCRAARDIASGEVILESRVPTVFALERSQRRARCAECAADLAHAPKSGPAAAGSASLSEVAGAEVAGADLAVPPPPPQVRCDACLGDAWFCAPCAAAPRVRHTAVFCAAARRFFGSRRLGPALDGPMRLLIAALAGHAVGEVDVASQEEQPLSAATTECPPPLSPQPATHPSNPAAPGTVVVPSASRSEEPQATTPALSATTRDRGILGAILHLEAHTGDARGGGGDIFDADEVPTLIRLCERARADVAAAVLAAKAKPPGMENELLPSAAELVDVLRRFNSNCFGVLSRDGRIVIGRAVYPVASMFNHSCEANAAHGWAEPTDAAIDGHTPGGLPATPLALRIRALADIPRGAEITISYLGDRTAPVAARRSVLWRDYRFHCRCPRCIRDDECAEPAGRIRITHARSTNRSLKNEPANRMTKRQRAKAEARAALRAAQAAEAEATTQS
jgi:hypothetical protein